MEKEKETLEGKKRHPILKGIVIVVVVLIVLCMVIPDGGNEDEVAERADVIEENQEEVQEPKEEMAEDKEMQQPEVQEEKEDQKAVQAGISYYEVGDTISKVWADNPDDGSIDMLITDMGLDHNKYDTDLLYVSLEIKNNTSKASLIAPDSNFNLYVDDYQYDTSGSETIREYLSFESEDSIIGGIEVNPGRKAKYTFRTAVTEEQMNGQTIELELFEGDAVLFKKDGEWLCDLEGSDTADLEGTELGGMEMADIKEGTYVSAESDTVITFKDGLVSVQFSDGYDFDGGVVDRNKDDSYYTFDPNGEYHEFIFMGESGLSVSGPVGGWYDRVD